MDTLKTAYKILYALEHRGGEKYAGQLISPEALDVPEDKWFEVMGTLIDEGYISGVKIGKDILGERFADIERAKITMKGAEYLSENGTMKKIGKIATNIISFVKK